MKLNYQKASEELRNWLKQYKLKRNDKKTLLPQLQNLIYAYLNPEAKSVTLGGFLTAISKNDFEKAVNLADKTNLSNIKIYAQFLYNFLPHDWKTVLA